MNKNIFGKIMMLIAPMFFVACTSYSGFELPAIISDGMVIQQNSNITFWGKAMPGTHVALHTDWDMSVTTTAQLDSTWELTFATRASDGMKHKLTFVLADTTVVLDDVLVGEVWLAAGQSNMEMPMEGWGNDTVADAKKFIETSEDDMLRYFTVERRIQFNEGGDIRGRWTKANPNTTPTMGAVAYLYGRIMRDSLNVPIGIVNASWGGTPIESWMSSSSLKDDPDFSSQVESFSTIAEELRQYKEWLKVLPSVDVEMRYDKNVDPLELINIDDEFAVLSSENFEAWDDITLPIYWESLPLFGEFDGVVWFAKEVQIPRSWLGKKMTLNLGPIDDRDVTFINGMCVGRHDKDGDYTKFRSYEVPSQYVKKSVVNIVVRVTDTKGYGGFSAKRHEMSLSTPEGDKISLAGDWKYRVSAELMDGNLYLFNMQKNQFNSRPRATKSLNQMSPTSIYNGMIEPLRRLSYAGFLWYQGETNVDRDDALQYERLLKKFLTSIRESFNAPDMPIYVMQIAPWEYTGCDETPGGKVRIAQYKVVKSMSNCMLIPTLDLGSSTNIHPCDKWSLAMRIARVALNNQYGFTHTAMGPMVRSASAVGPLVIMTFDNAKYLVYDSLKPNLFEVADESMEFFPADVVVRDNELTLFSHLVSSPVVVRYAVKNCVEPTLYNELGCPAPSFEERVSEKQ